MVSKKIIFISLLVFVVIIGIGIITYYNVTNIPSSEGKIIVKNSVAQGMLIAECANPTYVEETSDYIIEGEILSSETKWVENIESEGKNIYTYSDFKINNYIKGEPFEHEMIQIVTMGGCIGGICQSVEDGPIMTTGKKILYITSSNGEFSIHGCGGIKTLFYSVNYNNSPLTEAEAISILKTAYPEFKNYPNDNLPPKIIRTEKDTNGWYVAFVQLGSGRPILGAKCFYVKNDKNIQIIGDYNPPIIGDINFSIKTCD